MARFKVGFHYTEYGSAYVYADSAEEAEQIVHDLLEESGTEELTYETNDRDYGAQDAEQV